MKTSVDPATQKLLDYWAEGERERRRLKWAKRRAGWAQFGRYIGVITGVWLFYAVMISTAHADHVIRAGGPLFLALMACNGCVAHYVLKQTEREINEHPTDRGYVHILTVDGKAIEIAGAAPFLWVVSFVVIVPLSHLLRLIGVDAVPF